MYRASDSFLAFYHASCRKEEHKKKQIHVSTQFLYGKRDDKLSEEFSPVPQRPENETAVPIQTELSVSRK